MKENDKSPIEILAEVSPIAAKTYMDQRAAVMDNPEAEALLAKTKLLIGIGVASALQSSTCTLMWVKQARHAGASEAEIAEALMTARLMKSATVNDTAAEAMQWLLDQRKEV
ncbi:MAG: carboxymuconolactone decarboxylase family protein [Candidatus Aminicenantes bacterium]|nr:carboxymuconolactone decarboxylase family protein [Candidatus Aminicenantes bacterium]